MNKLDFFVVRVPFRIKCTNIPTYGMIHGTILSHCYWSTSNVHANYKSCFIKSARQIATHSLFDLCPTSKQRLQFLILIDIRMQLVEITVRCRFVPLHLSPTWRIPAIWESCMKPRKLTWTPTPIQTMAISTQVLISDSYILSRSTPIWKNDSYGRNSSYGRLK